VVFFTSGGVLTSASNNVVTANTTVQSLSYIHTNSATGTQIYQNTYINSGVTLTVSNVLATNAIFVGSGLSLAGAATTASISGPNGSLAVVATNGVINVRQDGSPDNYRMATLDLSGLSNCTIRAQRQVLKDLVEAYPGFIVAGGGTGTNPVRARLGSLLAQGGERSVAQGFIRHIEDISTRLAKFFPAQFLATRKTVRDDIFWMKGQFGRNEDLRTAL
jgi:hypothetical protein